MNICPCVWVHCLLLCIYCLQEQIAQLYDLFEDNQVDLTLPDLNVSLCHLVTEQNEKSHVYFYSADNRP